MEQKQDKEIIFGLEQGLIEPIENGKYKLTKKGSDFVKVASIVLAISIVKMLFTR